MNGTIVAATLLLGTLLTAPADAAAFTDQGRSGEAFSTAGSSERRAQIDAGINAQETRRHRRGQSRRHAKQATVRGRNRFACTGEVLHSEELTGAPIFHHFVRETLLITPPGAPAFETTSERLISWQVPPPRQGQRFKLPCDPAGLGYSAFH
jgi:hypothetical protein